MGLFGLFKKDNDSEDKIPTGVDEFHDFEDMYVIVKDSKAGKKEAAEHFLDVASHYDGNYINKMIRHGCKRDGSYGYKHEVFGFICELKDDHYSYILKKVKEYLDKENFREQKIAEFDNNLKKVSNHDIKLDESFVLERCALSDMPEIKLSPIGKAFDKTAKLSSFVVIDVETTGLKSAEDRILELSAIRFEDFEATDRFSTYISYDGDIPKEAQDVNHITKDLLIGAPDISQVAEDFIQFVGKSPIVGYNIAFDLKFLFTSGIDLLPKRKIYDVYALVKKADKDESYYGLENVCKSHNIIYDAHDSLNDCFATGILFKKILREYLN